MKRLRSAILSAPLVATVVVVSNSFTASLLDVVGPRPWVALGVRAGVVGLAGLSGALVAVALNWQSITAYGVVPLRHSPSATFAPEAQSQTPHALATLEPPPEAVAAPAVTASAVTAQVTDTAVAVSEPARTAIAVTSDTPPPVASAATSTTSVPAPLGAASADSLAESARVPLPVSSASDTPVQAVRTFYDLVQRKQFQAAERLWTQHMVGRFPPSENIVQRFAQSRDLTVQDAQVVSQDAAGHATVQVAIVERLDNAATRHYTGTWDLVRADNAWLLDQPDLRLD